MRKIYEESKEATSLTQRENLLLSYGLNYVEVSLNNTFNKISVVTSKQNALWAVQNSDPYKAYSYDTLHSDDLGKWGKHLWPLLLDILERSGCKGKLNE